MNGHTPLMITGVGVVAPTGLGKQCYWEQLRRGSPRYQVIGGMDHLAAACLRLPDVSRFIDRKLLRRLDRSGVFALIAAKLAVNDACLNLEQVERTRAGIAIGVEAGGVTFFDEQLDVFRRHGPSKTSPYLSIAEFLAGSMGQVSIELGLVGNCVSISDGGTGGIDSFGYACEALWHDGMDVMLVGATEAPVSLTMVDALRQSGLLTSGENGMRPYDQDASGFILGEGSALCVLERADFARQRAAAIWAEVVGYGTACGNSGMLPAWYSSESVERAVIAALAAAGVDQQDIDCIVGNGIGVAAVDRAELEGLYAVFGERLRLISLTSPKPMTGYPLGAAGALDVVTAVMVMRDSFVPATPNFRRCLLDGPFNIVAGAGRSKPVRHVLCVSLGLGGQASALVLRRPDRRSFIAA